MSHLISATLTNEAFEEWQRWQKGTRSAELSKLLEEQVWIHRKSEAQSRRIAHLQALLASSRDRLRFEMLVHPPLEEGFSTVLVSIIEAMNDETFGSVHWQPPRD